MLQAEYACPVDLETVKGLRVRLAYLGQGDIGHNDGVHGTGGSTEGLVLVAVRVVLVLVHLTILRDVVPGHGALADADVALGGHGGGLGAEVPAALQSVWSANCTMWSMSLLRSVAAWVGKYRHAQGGDNVTRGTQVGYEGREGIFTIQRPGRHRT